jgi:iron complex outermembrane receptor protein
MNEVGSFALFVSGKYSSFDFTDPGPVYAPFRTDGEIVRHGLTFGLDNRGDRSAYAVRIYHSYGEHEFSDGYNSIDRNNGVDLFARRILFTGQTSWALSGGGSVSYFGGSASNGTPAIAQGNFAETEYSAHAQTEIEWNNTLSLTVGVRSIHQERFGNHMVYQTGLVFSPEGVGSIKLSAGTAYRNPTIAELWLLPPGNDNLEPEEGAFYEIGYFKNVTSSISLESAIFWRSGENMIETVPMPGGPPQFRNIGVYDHSGWEASLRYADNGLTINPSYIHLNQDSHNSSVPEDKFALAASYRMERLAINISGVAAFKTASDSTYAISFPPFSSSTKVVLDDYFVMNAGGSYLISESVRFTFGVDNLLDTDYETVLGYPMPGTTLRAGIRFSLK